MKWPSSSMWRLRGVLVELGQALFQPLVRVVLVDHVGAEDGVEAPLVARVVVVDAAAAQGVLDALVVLFGLDELAEQKLGALLRVAVLKVGHVEDVGVLETVHVVGVEAHGEEADGDALVPQLELVDASVEVEDRGAQDLLDLLLRQWLGAVGAVGLPARFLPEAVEEVEDARVLLTVILRVDGRSPVGGEDVVEVLLALRDVGVVAALPALREEFLHVLVGDELVRWHGVLDVGLPLVADAVGRLELARVVEVPVLRPLAACLRPDARSELAELRGPLAGLLAAFRCLLLLRACLPRSLLGHSQQILRGCTRRKRRKFSVLAALLHLGLPATGELSRHGLADALPLPARGLLLAPGLGHGGRRSRRWGTIMHR